MKQCSNCHAEVPESAKFCPNCGISLSTGKTDNNQSSNVDFNSGSSLEEVTQLFEDIFDSPNISNVHEDIINNKNNNEGFDFEALLGGAVIFGIILFCFYTCGGCGSSYDSRLDSDEYNQSIGREVYFQQNGMEEAAKQERRERLRKLGY